jgi:hypothetical protein
MIAFASLSASVVVVREFDIPMGFCMDCGNACESARCGWCDRNAEKWVPRCSDCGREEWNGTCLDCLSDRTWLEAQVREEERESWERVCAGKPYPYEEWD